MSIKYHPKQETLLNFAAGNLSPAYMNVIEVHTKFCTGCASLISQFEQLGGATLSSQENTPVVTSFDDLMHFIDIASSTPTGSFRAEELQKLPPTEHIMQYAKLHPRHSSLRKDKWVNITRGIRDQKLDIRDPKYRSRLISIKSGTKIPSHTHQGEEITIVLKGSFSDDYGTYKAGDFIIRDGAYRHSPYADSDCICYTITDAPLHYTGLFGPVINWINQRFEKKHYGSVN